MGKMSGKNAKILYLNRKSCTAMFLAAALVFTSVDGMQVSAEEKLPEAPSVSDNDLGQGDNEAPKDSYVKTPEGAVIITSFEPLSEEAAQIELEGRETTEEVTSRMPAVLKAYADAYVTETPDEGGDSGEEEKKPDENGGTGEGGEDQPGGDNGTGEGGEGQPGGDNGTGEGGEDQPGGDNGTGEGGEGQPGGDNGTGEGGEGQPGGDNGTGEGGEGQPGGDNGAGEGGEGQPGGDNGAGEGGEGQPGGDNGAGEGGEGQPGGDNGAGEGGEGQPGGDNGTGEGGEGQPGGDNGAGEGTEGNDAGSQSDVDGGQPGADDVAAVKAGDSFAAADGYRWRFLVAVDGSGDEPGGDTGAGNEPGGSTETGDEPGGGTGAGNEPGGSTGAGDEPGGSTGAGDEPGGGTGAGDEPGGSTGAGDEPGGGTGAGDEPGGGTGAGDEPGGSTGAGDEPGGDTGAGNENGDGTGADVPGTGEPGVEIPPAGGQGQTKPVEVEVPVTWECAEYGMEELQEYIFYPKWDRAAWFYDQNAEGAIIPTITVYFAEEVSTEEGLAAAFAAGLKKVTLKKDIELTKPLRLPAEADIELDGQGCSLRRGKVTAEGEESGNAETFLGTMIVMDGEDYTEDRYGTLTLKNIAVNGETEAARAGAPAILDRGNLILDEGAAVRDNYNYGTYPKEGEDGEETVPDYGGGIQVYGELSVSPDALVTGNFADEFGGGVYLAEGAVLYLYADVIVDNSVGEGHGYGADLYAAPGSMIYYDPSIDMGREGFYICEGAILVPMGLAKVDLPVDGRKEVYISVAKDSGYSDKDVAALKDGLEKMGYTIITDRRTEIDTTDLRNWYVYDHYDTKYWGTGTTAEPPLKWLDKYGGEERRKFYPCTEGYGGASVITVADWLNSGRTTTIAKLQEHIYSRKEENGTSAMTLVGYGVPGYHDFLFYDPESDGEKQVNFDVDASKVGTHTLLGNGFLINAGVQDDKLYGYLVYYTYDTSAGGYNDAWAKQLSLYKLDGVAVNTLHESQSSHTAGTFVDSYTITKDKWKTQMSVQIKVTPEKVEVRQQPKTAETDIGQSDPVFSHTLEKTGYSGFGPYVAYQSHGCSQATSFTYSNLRMSFTDPMHEQKDMLNALEKADFTQDGTQKYFINLFGDSKLEYNEGANFGQYQEYMKMMQDEGIALVTDRDTPFDPYLGKANEPGSNLFELERDGGGRLTVEELIEKIHEGIPDDRTTTRVDDKLGLPPDAGGLAKPTPGQSVGNIWLQSEAGGQLRENLQGTAFADGKYVIRIMDNMTYYYGNPEDITVAYEVLKPGRIGYTALCTAKPYEGASFTVMTLTDDMRDWPAGTYTVRQRVSNGAIYGYAYFDLEQPVLPDKPVSYRVRVNVAARKNDSAWADSGKRFMLRSASGSLVDPSAGTVPAGNYEVYDVTESDEGVSTGIPVTVVNAAIAGTSMDVFVDYYTVTFHDGDTDYPEGSPQAERLLVKGQQISRPEEDPVKQGCRFRDWMTEDKGSTAYVFGTAIGEETHLYARWSYPVTAKVTVRRDGAEWQDHGRELRLWQAGSTETAEMAGLSEALYGGTYAVYDVTGLGEGTFPTDDRNTGVSVTVEDAGVPGTETEPVYVDYYTVTFYNENTADKKPCESGREPNPQIVLKNGKAGRPGFIPEKEKHEFIGWVSADGTAFDFDSKIDGPKEIYAGWKKIVEPRYTVTVAPKRDGEGWKESGRVFALRPEGVEGETVFDLAQVKKGTYRVYDVTGASSASYRARAAEADVAVLVDDGDTGVTVTVEDKDETAAVDYYTVTFYDGKKAYGTDSPQGPEIVLRGKKAEEPPAPKKSGYRFTGWKNGGGEAFSFSQAISGKADLYAGWKAVKSDPGKERKPEEGGGPEDTQIITVAQESSPQAEASRPASTAPGGKEPKTGDSAPVEVYATVAMIAGLTYLLLYFMEEGRGMTEREKEVFVAAFIRWAKKGGRFRRCCAVVAIFCLLLYYHSIGKRSRRNDFSREFLKQAL